MKRKHLLIGCDYIGRVKWMPFRVMFLWNHLRAHREGKHKHLLQKAALCIHRAEMLHCNDSFPLTGIVPMEFIYL